MSAQEVDPVWQVNPDGTLRFDPSSDPQDEFLNSVAREILFSGMLGSGKSIAMCIKAWRLCEYYPRIKGVALRRHYSDLKGSTLRLFPRLFGPRMWERGLMGGRQEPEGFQFPNKSQIDFLGVSGDATRTDKLKSTDYGFAMMDEVNELTLTEYRTVTGRLRQIGVPIRQAFSGCNPDGPHHWLYEHFDIGQGANKQYADLPCPRCQKNLKGDPRPPAPDCRTCRGRGTIRRLMRQLIMSGPHDNDAAHPVEYIAWRDSLTGLYGKRYRDGLWVAYEGTVFEQWDPNVHLIDSSSHALTRSWAKWDGLPPPDWRRIRSIDFGFDNPFVCQWWAVDPEGRWFRYREIYQSQVTLGRHAKRILELEADEMQRLRAAARRQGRYVDFRSILDGSFPLEIAPADHDRSDRETLAEAGIWTSPAKKDINAGIDMLIELLNPGQRGGTRLFLVKDALVERDQRLAFINPKPPACTEEEMGGYHWAKGVSGELAGRRKDLPVDLNNHGIDAMRYAVYSTTGGKKVAVY